MTALGLGIVGCGGAALDVARATAATDGLAVVAVHDTDRSRAVDLADRSGGRAHDTLASLLDDPRVDVVYVAVPHDLLAPIARTALVAGRHALVEKPMATTIEAIDDLQAVATARHLMLGAFYEMRFAPAAVAARSLVREGALGQVHAVRIRTLIDKPLDYWRVGLTGRADNPWRGRRARAGGGVVLMNTSHQLDLVASITGLHVTRVAGVVHTITPGIDVEDGAAAVLRYSNGAIGSLAAGAHVPGAIDGETIEIDGTLGQLRLDAYGGRLAIYLRRPWHDTTAGDWVEIETGDPDPFVPALATFVSAIRTGSRPPVGAPEAEAVVATVQAIYASAVEDRVVDLLVP